jgi:hypothetical protein
MRGRVSAGPGAMQDGERIGSTLERLHHVADAHAAM